MARSYTFTTKHYPTNELLALDFQEHLDQMARLGWALVGTEPLVKEHDSASPQLILFWGKGEGS